MLMFSCLLLSFVAYHQFSIASFKTVPVLRKLLKSLMEKRRCSCRAMPGSCRCGLPRAEGRKGAAARGEGRSPVAATEASNEAASRPSGQRVAAPFQAAERRPASRQRFVVRAGRRFANATNKYVRFAFAFVIFLLRLCLFPFAGCLLYNLGMRMNIPVQNGEHHTTQ